MEYPVFILRLENKFPIQSTHYLKKIFQDTEVVIIRTFFLNHFLNFKSGHGSTFLVSNYLKLSPQLLPLLTEDKIHHCIRSKYNIEMFS